MGKSVIICLAACCMSACASNSPYGPERPDDDFCLAGETLVCEERVNDVTRCICSSKDALKDILEPARPRLN